MSFFARNTTALLVVIIFSTPISTPVLFAKTFPIKSTLVLVPKHKTQKAQEQLVANLITQKFFLSLKGHREYQEKYHMSFVFTSSLESKDSAQLATHYLQKDYINVVVVKTEYNTKTEKYNVVIDFFYLGKKIENLKSISFTTTFENVFNALYLSDIVKPEVFNSITQKLSKMLEVFSRLYKRSIITFTHQNENTENSNPYFVRINGVMVEEPSPKKIVIYEKKNFITILQEDDSHKQVNIGSFVVSPILNEYNVIIKKQPGKKQTPRLFSKSNMSFLDSLVTTNFLLGYSYVALGEKVFRSPHLFSGAVRVTFSPKVPLLALGIEVPFIITPEEKSQEVNHSLLGLSAFIGGIFPIAKNMEATIHGGGGFFSISTLDINENIGKIQNKSQIQPQLNGGVGFAYNIPIKEAGYIRMLLDISTTFSILESSNYSNTAQKNTTLDDTKKLQYTSSILFINASFGIGIRF